MDAKIHRNTPVLNLLNTNIFFLVIIQGCFVGNWIPISYWWVLNLKKTVFLFFKWMAEWPFYFSFENQLIIKFTDRAFGTRILQKDMYMKVFATLIQYGIYNSNKIIKFLCQSIISAAKLKETDNKI